MTTTDSAWRSSIPHYDDAYNGFHAIVALTWGCIASEYSIRSIGPYTYAIGNGTTSITMWLWADGAAVGTTSIDKPRVLYADPDYFTKLVDLIKKRLNK